MISAKAVVRNALGIHMLSAGAIVETCNRFKAKIWLQKGKRKSNARSILDIILLESPPGTQLTIEADGEDEREALDALLALFDRNFGEK